MALGALLVCLVLILIIGTLAASALDAGHARQRRMFQEWVASCRAAGLDAQQAGDNECRARGVLHDASIHASLKFGHEGNTPVYRSMVWASGSFPRHLSLQPSSGLRSLARWMEGQELAIGDPAFDAQIELSALDALVCAALSHRARGHITQLLGWGGYVADGMVVCRSTWSAQHNSSLQQLLRSVAALAHLLSIAPAELPARLARNAIDDPAPGVRLANLRYLAAPETQAPPELLAATAAELLLDSHAPTRLLAATHAGEAGHAVLRAVAADPGVDLTLRIRAVEALARHPIPDLEGLRAALGTAHPPELTVAALSVIGKSSDAGLLEAVIDCTRSQHDSVRAGAARALSAFAQPHTEPLLLELLSDVSSDVQQASAEALGLFGSVAAVEPLLPLAESLVRPRLRQAARGAIGRIQSRLGDAEAGRLSLSDPHGLAGALDMADPSTRSRVGAVSLVEEPEARAGDATPGRARRGRAPSGEV